MRVAILNITGGGMSKGYVKYLGHVISRMVKDPSVDALMCITPASVDLDAIKKNCPQVQWGPCLPFGVRSAFFHFGIPTSLDTFQPDVIFIPMERYVRYRNVPVVNMLRNMLPQISIPEVSFREKIRESVQRWVTRRAVSRASRVIAVSQFVKDFLVSHWHISPSRIGLVYHGVDCLNTDGERPEQIPEAWTSFLFTAGSLDHPYRGLEDLLEALGRLKQSGIILNVVVAGSTCGRPDYKKRLDKLVDRHHLEDQICWAGTLSEPEMIWCYRHCRIFVMTSRVEACPNIALEALSYGCELVVANNPPLPEFFADAASYYPPRDAECLSKMLMRAVSSSRSFQTHEKSKAIALRYSWDLTVSGILAELKKAIQQVY